MTKPHQPTSPTREQWIADTLFRLTTNIAAYCRFGPPPEIIGGGLEEWKATHAKYQATTEAAIDAWIATGNLPEEDATVFCLYHRAGQAFRIAKNITITQACYPKDTHESEIFRDLLVRYWNEGGIVDAFQLHVASGTDAEATSDMQRHALNTIWSEAPINLAEVAWQTIQNSMNADNLLPLGEQTEKYVRSALQECAREALKIVLPLPPEPPTEA